VCCPTVIVITAALAERLYTCGDERQQRQGALSGLAQLGEEIRDRTRPDYLRRFGSHRLACCAARFCSQCAFRTGRRVAALSLSSRSALGPGPLRHKAFVLERTASAVRPGPT
jgi:hypothetical protein